MNIVNIVCEYKLLGEIDISNFEKTKNFTGFTLKKGSQTCRAFKSNYFIVTGIRNIRDGDNMIREIFPNNPLITRKIILITATAKVPFPFSFSGLLR